MPASPSQVEILSQQGWSWWHLFITAPFLVLLLWQSHRWMLYPIPPRQRWTLVLVRTLWTILLLWCLWDPVMQREWTESKKVNPRVTVLVDSSKSMNLDGPGSTEEAAIQKTIARLRDKLQNVESEKLSWKFMGNSLRSWQPSQPILFQDTQSLLVSQIAETSEQGSAGTGPSLFFLVTDGRDTTEAPPGSIIKLLQNRKTQVFPLLLPDTRQPPSMVNLERILAPAELRMNESFDIHVDLRSSGNPPSNHSLTLEKDGREISSRTIHPVGNGILRESFPLHAESEGLSLYSILLKASDGKVLARLSTSVFVKTRDKIRVLYIQGRPVWELRYLRQALSGNPDIQLETFSMLQNKTILHQVDDQAVKGSTVSPASALRTAADHQEVLVLSNIQQEHLDQETQQALLDFVQKKGGGILFFTGESKEASTLRKSLLEELLPVTFEALEKENKSEADFKSRFTQEFGKPSPSSPKEKFQMGATNYVLNLSAVKITADGQASEVWRDAHAQSSLPQPLPTFENYVRIKSLKPGAILLGTHSENPALPLFACQNVGAGRSAFLGIDGLWRWRMKEPLDAHNYERFWQQLFLWLGARVESFRMETDKGKYQPGDIAHISLFCREDSKNITLTARSIDGIETPIPLQWEASQTIAKASKNLPEKGEIIFTLRNNQQILAQRMVDVSTQDLEREYSGLNLPFLQQLAEGTNGRCLQAGELGTLDSLLAQREETHTHRSRKSLWHSPWIFLGILFLYGAELLLRKRFQLT